MMRRIARTIKTKIKPITLSAVIAASSLSSGTASACSGCCCCSECIQSYVNAAITISLSFPAQLTIVSQITGAPPNPTALLPVLFKAIGEKGSTVSGASNSSFAMLSKTSVDNTKAIVKAMHRLEEYDSQRRQANAVTRKTYANMYDMTALKTKGQMPDLVKDFNNHMDQVISQALKEPIGDDTIKTEVVGFADILDAAVNDDMLCEYPLVDQRQLDETNYHACSDPKALKSKMNVMNIVTRDNGFIDRTLEDAKRLEDKGKLKGADAKRLMAQAKIAKMRMQVPQKVMETVMNYSLYSTMMRKNLFKMSITNPEWFKILNGMGNETEIRKEMLYQLSLRNTMLLGRLKMDQDLAMLKATWMGSQIANKEKRTLDAVKDAMTGGTK